MNEGCDEGNANRERQHEEDRGKGLAGKGTSDELLARIGHIGECRKLKRCRGWWWALGKAEKACCRLPCRGASSP